jgi:hypothetical protein
VSADGDLPAPLVPAEVDLRDYAYMPLHVVRLRDSGIAAIEDPEAFRAAVISWCVAWHQVPAGSLPSGDSELARMLGYGRDMRTFRRVREHGALRNFILCADGRLYHPVVCGLAIEAWAGKRKQAQRTEMARKTLAVRRGERAVTEAVTEAVTASVGDDCTDFVTGSKERRGEESESKSKSRLILSSRASARNAPEKKDTPQKTRIPDAFTASAHVRTWAMLEGITQTDLDRHVEAFVGRCRRNGYRYADWDAALQSAITEDWAGLRTAAKSAHDARHGTARDWLDDDDRPHV